MIGVNPSLLPLSDSKHWRSRRAREYISGADLATVCNGAPVDADVVTMGATRGQGGPRGEGEQWAGCGAFWIEPARS